MWSKKPMPVANLACPVPSRSRRRAILVSPVSRRISALRPGVTWRSVAGAFDLDMVFPWSNDRPQFGQQTLDLGVRADADAQPVSRLAIVHVANQNLAAPELLENRLHWSVAARRPDEIGMAGQDV